MVPLKLLQVPNFLCDVLKFVLSGFYTGVKRLIKQAEGKTLVTTKKIARVSTKLKDPPGYFSGC